MSTLTADEVRRLAALEQYEILDTLPEQALDELTQLAGDLCQVPVALISLVDEHRQWFKSKIGIEASQTPREVSFCAHALHQTEIFTVTDATQDQRFADNPLVTGEPNIRFYAGAPLVTPTGEVLGTLCVIDREARVLTDIQAHSLRILGRQVMTHLELRRQTKDLLNSEARLAAVIKGSPVGLAIHRWEDRRIVDVNPAFTSITGWSAEEVIGRTLVEIGTVGVLEAAKLGKLLQTNGELRNADIQICTPQGEVRHLLMGAEFIEINREPHTVSTFVDITDRKRSEDRFRRLVESNAQGVLFWNNQGEITEANDAFLKIVGYDRKILETRPLLLSDLTPPEFAHLDKRAQEEIRLSQSCAPFEKEYLRADGSRVPVLVGAACFEDKPDEGVCFVLDLTERKRLENQFLQAQRMESIGTLSSGIAHDLNNSLSPIFMALTILESRCPDPESREMLSIVSTSSQRAASMVGQILSFARGVGGHRWEVSLLEVLGEVAKIVRETFPKSIQLHCSWPTNLRTVTGDVTQIHQVLLNLCLNARDAMPLGGTLTLSAADVLMDKHSLALQPELVPGNYVWLTVADNGCGIPAGVIEKIFEPFFTTKPIGQGTGLGLSSAQAIVRSHGGFIRVYSEPGQGTRFTLWLPASQGTVAKPEEELLDLPAGQGEWILLVEDEPALLLVTKQTLEASGYQVVTATNGAEALAIFTLRRSEISLVLTDVMMPVMDGSAVVPVLRRMQPALPIVASSGLSSPAQELQLTRLGVRHFLPKPYTASSLLRTLQQALRDSPPDQKPA